MSYFRPLTIRFFWVMLAATVGTVALGLVIFIATGRPPPAVLSVLPVAVAGFDAGRRHKRWAGVGLGMKDGLLLALGFFAVHLITSAVIVIGAFATQGILSELTARLPSLIGPLALFSLLFFITIRVMMWFGARTVD